MSHPQRAKRRIQLIKPRLQLRLILTFTGLATFVLLFQALLISSFLIEAAPTLPSGGTYLMDLLPSLLGKVVLISLGVLLPLSLAIGTLTTFRIAGPVYRFEQFLKSVARGERTGPCRIRKGDALQDLCDLINEAVDAARRAPRANEATGDEEPQEDLRRAG